MKFHWQPLLALYLLSCLSFAGQGKQTHGEVADADGLLKIHTFCLDSSQLAASQLTDLRGFAAQAESAKGVFTKMHWQRVDNCDSVDAIVKLYLSETVGTGPVGDGSSLTLEHLPAGLKAERHSQAGMVITKRTSGKPLYVVKGKEFIDDRQSAFEDTFSKLSKDLKALAK